MKHNHQLQSDMRQNNPFSTTDRGVRSHVYQSQQNTKSSANTIITNQDLLMMALVRFYKQNNNANMMRVLPIIEGKSVISLRLIDWFVTNFSKKYNTIILNQTNTSQFFNVYISYRQQLKAFSKQMFDPFRRRDRIKFYYDKDNNWIETTIGQLNFFKWILHNSILDYICENMELIEADMIASQKSTKDRNKSNKLHDKAIEADVKKSKHSKSSSGKVKSDRLQITRSCLATPNIQIGPKIIRFD